MSDVYQETRASKSRVLKRLLHRAFEQNPSPDWKEVKALEKLLLSRTDLDPSELATINTKMLSKWFRDQRYYRKRYTLEHG